MNSIYQSLEFNRIIEMIQNKCRTEKGIKHLQALRCFHDENLLRNELVILKEMDSLILRFGAMPISHSADLTKLIEHAIKGGILSINDLEHVASDVLTSLSLRKYIKNINSDFPYLNQAVEKFVDLQFLEKSIHRIISPNLSIYDDASTELKRIRRKIVNLEQDISGKLRTISQGYANLLADNTIVFRNGHYVLPVKTSEKNKVPGIIHDVSDTGMTTYIEPSLIVSISNEIQVLKQAEHEEINRLLRELTKEVITCKEEVICNNNIIGYLDFVSAKAQYGIEYKAVVAEISEMPLIDIKNAKHPLIAPNKSVGNNFYLDNKNHVMVISGPNAGGKSVALKVVGSAVVMHQCGLPVLANEGAKISVFKRIYIDIGDQQSLSDSLSTFSAHMKNIVEMTSLLGGKDLLIFDELGTGTDPHEGEALAKSIIKHIHFKHAIALVTSHFSGVKTFALENDYIVNASMVFDESNMVPTYRLQVGIPGKSYGMEMAERLGLDKAIIDSARIFLKNTQNQRIDGSIDRLSKLISETENIRNDLSKKLESYESKTEKLNKLETQLDNRRAKLLEDVEKEKNDMIEDTKAKIDEIMRSLNSGNIKLHEAIAVKAKLDELEEEEREVLSTDENFELGDYVIISDLNLTGKITRLNKNKATILTSAGNVNADITSLIKTNPPVQKKALQVSSYKVDDELLKRQVKLEVNLIGMRVEEGLSELTRYLDNVRVKNFKQIRVIHGSGTGVLRSAVHEYLSKQSYVESYRLGGLNEGGVGATVVYLK